jgi:hypothetical protein
VKNLLGGARSRSQGSAENQLALVVKSYESHFELTKRLDECRDSRKWKEDQAGLLDSLGSISQTLAGQSNCLSESELSKNLRDLQQNIGAGFQVYGTLFDMVAQEALQHQMGRYLEFEARAQPKK